MTSREHPTATITTPNSTPGQSGRFGSESVAAFVGMRTKKNESAVEELIEEEKPTPVSLLSRHGNLKENHNA